MTTSVLSCFCLLFVLLFSWSDALYMPKIYSSNMVLQRNKLNCIYGTAAARSTVTLNVVTDNTGIPAGSRQFTFSNITRADLTFTVCLSNAVFARFQYTPFNISVSDTVDSVTFTNVIFGEVVICSGQSNMEIAMNVVFNYSFFRDETKSSQMRLFKVTNNYTQNPQEDVVGGTWIDNSKSTAFAQFSAVCYSYGREALNVMGVPIGVIEAAYSGSAIECWISKEAFAPLGYTFAGQGTVSMQAGLYNAMIYPLRNFSVAGFLWYQGESNAGQNANYIKASRAMLADWRLKFQDQTLFFGYVPLAPRVGFTAYISFRLAQVEAFKDVPYTYYTSINDMGDPNTTIGDAHPRNKTLIGPRLFKKIGADYYGLDINPSFGPQVESCCSTNSSTQYKFYLNFETGRNLFEMNTPFCFQCCSGSRPFDVTTTPSGSVDVSSVTYNGNQAILTINSSAIPAGRVLGQVRLNADAYPDCAVYGGRDLLIAPPFSLQCSTPCGSTTSSTTSRTTSGPASSGPTSAGPSSTGPSSTGPTSTSSPASSGSSSNGPTSTGPTSTGPTSPTNSATSSQTSSPSSAYSLCPAFFVVAMLVIANL